MKEDYNKLNKTFINKRGHPYRIITEPYQKKNENGKKLGNQFSWG